MIAPFYKFGYFNSEVGLIVAFVIGIFFGFFLERGGFGSGRLLAAQFYFYDMRVFKVMFTAIVTAAVGLYYLAWIGFLDLNLVYYGETYIYADALGGLILGMGFVIGGYCPGTSGVAISTGRIDAIFYALGGFLGIFVFGELYPSMQSFLNSGYLGKISIPQYFHLNYGFVILVVILIAIGGFTLVEWVEKKLAGKYEEVE